MFQNYVKTINHLYPTFRRIDKCMGNAILDPLMDCLDILTDEDAEDRDVRCMAQIMIESGKLLNEVRPVLVENLIMKLRQIICAKDIPLSEETNVFLLNIIDLYTYRWDSQAIPDCLKRFYEEQLPSDARQWEYTNRSSRKRTTSLLGVPGSSGSTTSDDPSPSLSHSRTATPDNASKHSNISEAESLV
uniref:MIF4G domain-containing protein n=1 Tax=Acrobeloides nanus TaxID=290746 RepID=A0A914CRG7_9BILA